MPLVAHLVSLFLTTYFFTEKCICFSNGIFETVLVFPFFNLLLVTHNTNYYVASVTSNYNRVFLFLAVVGGKCNCLLRGFWESAEFGSPNFAFRQNPILLLQAHYTTSLHRPRKQGWESTKEDEGGKNRTETCIGSVSSSRNPILWEERVTAIVEHFRRQSLKYRKRLLM
jgi:hypothetical protein